jgi:RNA polymerase sigma factor (sigma-70 family)
MMRLRDKLVNEQGFSVFYREHAESLMAFFVRRTCDVEASLDLTAETFAQAFARRRTFRGATSQEAGAWLFAIASRQLAGYLRRGYARRRLVDRLGIEVPRPDEFESERALQLAGIKALQPLIREELERLSHPQRDALRLRVVEEMPYARVAERLGISERAARMRVSRALAAIASGFEARNITREDLT